MEAELLPYMVMAAAYVVTLGLSGFVVRGSLRWCGADVDITDADRDTGTVIGKIENVLVITLMLSSAFTALGLIFAAKSLVRKQDMDSGDTAYYLVGTLANFTTSVAIGALALTVLDLL